MYIHLLCGHMIPKPYLQKGVYIRHEAIHHD